METDDNFEKFYKANIDKGAVAEYLTGDMSLKAFAKFFYDQGHLDPTPVGKEVSIESVEEDLKTNSFLEFIQSCLIDPVNADTVKESCDWVEVTYPCTKEDKEKCVAWPDRCQECGGDGETCGKSVINLSKLCGVDKKDSIFIKDKETITPQEAKLLSDTLIDFYNKENEKCL